MAVIRRHYTSFREMETSDRGSSVIQMHRKSGVEYKLPMEKNKQLMFEVDDYLAAPMHGLGTLEPKDAQVPEYSADSNIIDLSSAMSPTLDTPSIIESFVDELPFRFLPDPGFGSPPTDIVQAATASAMLALEEETYQDLTEMIVNDKPLSMACSPGSLLSPDESNYSDVSLSNSGSPNSILSAASTSNDPRFFAPDFEVLTSKESSVKDETSLVMRCRNSGGSTDIRYSEMRRKNNMASRRSRLSRRDKEREMEQQQQKFQEDNVSLKAQVKELEALVAKVKAILISVVAQKSNSQAGKQ